MRTSYLLAISFLAASVPAAAQSHFQLASAGAAPPQPIYAARLETPPTAVLTFSRGRDSFPEPPSPLRDRALSLGSLAATSETPFAQQVNFPVLCPPSGRFEVGGFFAMRPMENLLWGLPGAGSLPARGVAGHSHPGVWAPYPEQSFGLSLRIHLHGRADLTSRPQAWRCLGKLLRLGLS